MEIPAPRLIALRDHPRAGPGIRRAKAWGGLAGFGLMILAGLLSGGDPADALLRALAGGLAGYLVMWVVAIAVWIQVLRAEATTAARRAVERSRRTAEGGGAG